MESPLIKSDGIVNVIIVVENTEPDYLPWKIRKIWKEYVSMYSQKPSAQLLFFFFIQETNYLTSHYGELQYVFGYVLKTAYLTVVWIADNERAILISSESCIFSFTYWDK